jgi:hypothetical protein
MDDVRWKTKDVFEKHPLLPTTIFGIGWVTKRNGEYVNCEFDNCGE